MHRHAHLFSRLVSWENLLRAARNASRRKTRRPVGNLTSQWFANWYLDAFDHTLTSRLRVGGYLRYCDDFILLDNDRARLMDLRGRVEELLAGLRLRLHPDKTAIVPVRSGVTFVGYRTWPRRRTVRSSNMRAFLKRLRHYGRLLAGGEMSREDYIQRINSWLGHASQADDPRLIERALDRAAAIAKDPRSHAPRGNAGPDALRPGRQ